MSPNRLSSFFFRLAIYFNDTKDDIQLESLPNNKDPIRQFDLLIIIAAGVLASLLLLILKTIKSFAHGKHSLKDHTYENYYNGVSIDLDRRLDNDRITSTRHADANTAAHHRNAVSDEIRDCLSTRT